MTIENFRDLSVCLTGVKTLPQSQCESLLARLINAEGYSLHVEPVFSIFIKHGNDLLPHLNKDQIKCCKGIAFLWYTSELIPFQQTPDDVEKEREGGSQEEYYEALIWKVIRAHPPGLTGGYYGHWRYEPEN